MTRLTNILLVGAVLGFITGCGGSSDSPPAGSGDNSTPDPIDTPLGTESPEPNDSNSSPTPTPTPTLSPAPMVTPGPLIAADSFFTALGLVGCVDFAFNGSSSQLCSQDGEYTEGFFGSFHYLFREGENPNFPISISQQPTGQRCVFENGESTIMLNELTDIPSVTCGDESASLRIYKIRENYRALLESEHSISHCLGSSETATLTDYADLMPVNNQPALFIEFLDLANINTESLARLRQLFKEYRAAGHYMALQLGLNLTFHPDPTTHYEHDVAAGLYDTQIDLLAHTLADFGHPVYLRIGIEFNGAEWIGYEPEPYKAAFIRITNAMRSASSEIATVWHAVSERTTANPYAINDYYPGDEYVDWWALSLFEVQDFTHPSVTQFLADAHSARKPVMIAESTPLGIGVDNGQADWNNWFEPFFQLVADQPGIKSVCYINWDWNNRLDVWSHWGNAQVQDNAVIADNYRAEWTHPMYQHSLPETAFREVFLSGEVLATPAAVNNVQVVEQASRLLISWEHPSSNLLRYDVYLNDQLFDHTTEKSLTLPFHQLEVGTELSFQVVALNQNGLPGTASSPVSYAVPTSLEKIVNGDFEAGVAQWTLRFFTQGEFSLTTEDTSPLAGEYSGQLTIDRASDMNWHMQLTQPLATFKDKHYRVQYQLQANADVSLLVGLQQNDAPYEFSYLATHDLTANTPISVDESVIEAADDQRVFTLFVGDLSEGVELKIDAVSVLESVN